MKTIEVITECQATLTERWVLRVSDEDAADIIRDPALALDALAAADAEVVSVEDIGTRDEQDRDVTEVAIIPAVPA